MFGVMFKTFRGELEMAIRKVYTDRKAAELAKQSIISNFGPTLSSRYIVVEIKALEIFS